MLLGGAAGARLKAGWRFWCSLLIGVGSGAAAVGSVGPWIRGHVRERAARYGAAVAVESAYPLLDGVSLRGVGVELEGVSGVRVWVDEVRVDWTTRRPKAVSGLKVLAHGEPEVLLRQLREWRGRLPKGDGTTGPRGDLPKIEGVVLDWRRGVSDSEDRVHLSGGALSRPEASVLALACDSLVARLGHWSARAAGGTATLVEEGEGWKLADLRTEGLDVSLEGGSESDTKGLDARDQGSETGQLLKGRLEARFGGLRSRALALGELADHFLSSSVQVVLDGARFKTAVASQPLELGPGRLSIRRGDGGLSVELEPSGLRASLGDAGVARHLRFRAIVPVSRQDAAGDRSIVAEIVGGPISLVQLGLKEGDFGLFGVASASISTDAKVELAKDVLRVDGSGKIRRLGLRHPWLAADAVEGIELAWRGGVDVRLDGSRIDFRDAESDFGNIRLKLDGSFRQAASGEVASSSLAGAKVDMRFEVPLTNCQAIFDSLPSALVPKLAGMTFAGSLSARGHVRFDADSLPSSYEVDWDGTQSCRVVEVPEAIRVDHFKEPFEKLVYSPEGKEKQMSFGPGTPGWVPLSRVSKYMSVAVQLCEDGRFLRHHGFDKEAIVNSMRDNLVAGAFRRGASTISMQLAKNLYLSREKRLSRKLQEAILTLYLEQVLTKQEILELYFNVIEFGPMVYGIGPAARHHFASSATQLSLGQSLYLASILQNPKKQFYGAGGVVTPSRMDYLRKLMKLGRKVHLLSDADVDEGLNEIVAFGRPYTPPAPEGQEDGAPPETAISAPEPDRQNGISSSSPLNSPPSN